MSAYQASHSDMKDQLASARTRPLAFPNLGADLMPMEKDLLVIRKALHPQLEHRFADAGELLSALEGEAQIDASDVAPITRGTQQSTGPIGFDAIAGMDELKDALSDEVLGPLRNPEKYRAYGLTIPNGMLLYGPPGCGKTFISERFAEEAGLEFKKIVPSNLASIYVHGSQEKIGQLFSEARQLAPCILFFDELDALLPKRDGIGVNPGAASEVNEFLAQMNNASEAGVFIMGATNRPHLIDLAVMRTGRLDKKIYVGPPDHAARKAMFILYLSHRPTDVSIDFDELAHRTDKRVSSDIKYIVDEASRAALRKDVDISQSILLAAIDGTKPSVSHEEINRYEAMKASMNSGGEIGSQDRPTIGFQFGKQSQES
jgi:transitional endoplasmic reticulum ATPase